MGLTLIGADISLTDHASYLKAQGEPWFWLGTLGLVVLNSGVALMADAVKNRVLFEMGRASRTAGGEVVFRLKLRNPAKKTIE